MQVTPSRIFLGCCLGFLSGVFFTSVYSPSVWIPYMLCVLGAFIAAAGLPLRARFGSKKFFVAAAGFALFGFSLGVIRTQAFGADITRTSVLRFGEGGATFTGIVARYPEVRKNDVHVLFDASSVNGIAATGRVLLSLPKGAEVSYGDILSVAGKVKKPTPFGGFDYPAYLAKDGVTALADAQEYTVVGSGGNAIMRALNGSRKALDRAMLRILPYREGGLLKAILLGDETSMSDSFKEALNRAGLRHIVAVSGMNITIIMGMLVGAALGIGMWRQQAFFFGIGGVLLFVLLIGFPASAVRAAIMGIAIRAAPLLSRRGSGFRAAITAAAVMVGISPLTLRYDVGFQLSFLAVLGIIFLTPIFLRLFGRLPRWIAEVLAMTCAAQVFVFPLLLSVFGQVSLIGPLSNLVVVPFLPAVTVWGFIAAVAGAFGIFAGSVLAAPLLPYLSFVVVMTEKAATFPIAALQISPTAFLLGTGLWYMVLARVAWREAHRIPRPIDLVKREGGAEHNNI